MDFYIKFGFIFVGIVYIEVWTMLILWSHDGSNREAPEVSSRYVASLNDIAVYIRRVKESAPSLFSATVGSIFVEDWTRVMSQNLRALPKNFKVIIACMFFRGEPAAWFERAVQPRIYRWNKFRSLLERNFGSFGADWERRMVKEFGNSTDDSSEGALVDMRVQALQMPQAEMLEVIAVMMVMRRRILKKSQMGLKPKRWV